MKHLPEVLGEYEKQNGARFHMPGHKGRGMAGFWRSSLSKWDVTELSGTDNLHAPEGALLQAQQDCAQAFGAADSFFLVNGSTSGILAMLLSLPAGSHVLLGRDCHRSAISGLVLAGHSCSFVYPAYENGFGMFSMVEAAAIDAALAAQPAQAVLIVSPNYYGLCADLPAIAAVCRKHGALLFVDAAHGAHFPFGKTLPESPAGYADLWVQSAHKTLNALGQSALLHRGSRCTVSRERLLYALSIVETSSPSYLLMASLDWARYCALTRQDWDHEAALCKKLQKSIGALPGFRVLTHALTGQAGIADADPTRLTIDTTLRGITGFAAAAALEQENVFVEMADPRRIVCICTPSDDPNWYAMLYKALTRLPYGTTEPPPQPKMQTPPTARLSPRDAALGETELIVPEQAAGRIAAEAVGAYPPGIALWIPGEEITDGNVSQLMQQRAMGAAVFGLRNGMLSVVK